MSKFIVRAPAITQILKRPFLGGFYRMQPSSSLELLAFNVAQRCAATCRAALRSTGRDAVQFIIVQFTVQFYSKLQLGVTNSLQRARFASHFNWNTVWLMHTKDFVVCCWSAQWLQWKSFWLCQEHMEVFRNTSWNKYRAPCDSCATLWIDKPVDGNHLSRFWFAVGTSKSILFPHVTVKGINFLN